MSCPLNPADCIGDVVGTSVGDVVSSAWDSICQSFATAASDFLTSFATAFAHFPDTSVSDPGVRKVYGVSLGIAAIIAALLLIGQVIRTAYTQEGRALATGLVGVGRTAIACLLTLVVGGAAMQAADDLTTGIINYTYGSEDAFTKKLGTVFAWDGSASGSILLVMGCIGILLTAVLWFELLLRNAALAVLLATAPIAAAGQVSESTKSWWTKSVSATVQLIVLKPLIALVMFLGFSVAGESTGIANTISGMLILVLAVLAWPAVARFFTFASVSVAGGAGLGALIGAGAGAMSSGGIFGGSGGGASSSGKTGGVAPSQFSQQAESRTMGAGSDESGAPSSRMTKGSGGGAGGAAASGAKSAGIKQALGAAAGPAAMALQLGQKAANSMTGRMETMAGHAGIQGANPHAQPAGRPPIMQESFGGRGAPTSGSGAAASPQPASIQPSSQASAGQSAGETAGQSADQNAGQSAGENAGQPAGQNSEAAATAQEPLSAQSADRNSASNAQTSAAEPQQQPPSQAANPAAQSTQPTSPPQGTAGEATQPTPPVPPAERPAPPKSTTDGE
jgi:hypothetical protein